MTSPRTSTLTRLTLDERRAASVTHVEHVPARGAEVGTWPAWADPLLVDRLMAAGVTAPWVH